MEISIQYKYSLVLGSYEILFENLSKTFSYLIFIIFQTNIPSNIPYICCLYPTSWLVADLLSTPQNLTGSIPCNLPWRASACKSQTHSPRAGCTIAG